MVALNMLIGARDRGFLNYEMSKVRVGGFVRESDPLNPLVIVIVDFPLLY